MNRTRSLAAAIFAAVALAMLPALPFLSAGCSPSNPSPAPVAKAAGHAYGWHRSTRPSPHPRYAIAPRLIGAPLPASVDLTPGCPPVYDQGQLGSCTGNALAGLVQYLQVKLGLPSRVPSRLMIYWGERAIEGTISQDAGANGDDGMTFLQTKGVCPESSWPYIPAKFAIEPPAPCWAQAAQHTVSGVATIGQTEAELKTWLATEKAPIAFGFAAFPELESRQVAGSGVLPMPARGEPSIGGHEVLLVGYDDATRLFKVRNSWGAGWGLNGYYYMPYAYVLNPGLAGDFRSATHAR